MYPPTAPAAESASNRYGVRTAAPRVRASGADTRAIEDEYQCDPTGLLVFR
jgi:hypothetical protein